MAFNDLLKLKWEWDDYYKVSYFKPSTYNKALDIISDIRKNKLMHHEDIAMISSLLKIYIDKYYHLKKLKSQEPRLHAQKFISKRNVRAFIIRRDGNLCLCCNSRKDLSLDHILPISQGGENKLSNLQTLCKSCNSKKGTKYKDFR